MIGKFRRLSHLHENRHPLVKFFIACFGGLGPGDEGLCCGSADVAARGANPREAASRPERVGSPAGKVPPKSRSRVAVHGSDLSVGFAVQVGAFADSASAERLANSLRGKGFRVYVSGSREEGASRWRVRVGPMETREAAERSAARLKAEETLPTWVLEEGRP